MFTPSWKSENPGLFTCKQMNMEQHEKEQLLLKKKHLEERIAKHQAIVDSNLKDRDPKRPDFGEQIKKPQAIVEDAEKDLAEVNRQLGLLP